MNSKHEFSFYWPELKQYTKREGLLVEIIDESLQRRVTQVVRLAIGDSLLLFDRSYHAIAVIEKINKKSFAVVLQKITANRIFASEIIFFLPVLKKEALETAIYSMVELGASQIQLVHTAKVQRKWAGVAELERLQKIIIAAAEQSKNFNMPQLHEPISLENALHKFPHHDSVSCFADVTGMPLMSWVAMMHKSDQAKIRLMIGPEGDLTESEKNLLKEKQFIFCQLTPTIIRSCQAAGLLLAIARSIKHEVH